MLIQKRVIVRTNWEPIALEKCGSKKGFRQLEINDFEIL